MHLDTGLLALTGSLCLLLALVLAWGLAGVRSSALVATRIASPQHLLKAHIDFLMMTGLLFVFYLLFEHLHVVPPAVVVGTMCLGSMSNPAGFFALAIAPGLPQRPGTPFGVVMLCSFTATTIGYGGAAWYVAQAVMFAR